MKHDKFELAWNLMTELRKEIRQAQMTRTQVIGFKITIVSTGIGLIAANINVTSPLLIIPAYAAIFFDLLINSYSVSIKRAGYYCRIHIEPILRKCAKWPEQSPLWEEYMSQPRAVQRLSLIGNFGLTCLSVIIAILALFNHPYSTTYFYFLIPLILFTLYDFIIFLRPRHIAERGFGNIKGQFWVKNNRLSTWLKRKFSGRGNTAD